MCVFHTCPHKHIIGRQGKVAISNHQDDCLFYYGLVSNLMICDHSNIKVTYNHAVHGTAFPLLIPVDVTNFELKQLD